MKKTAVKLICALTSLLLVLTSFAACVDKGTYRNDVSESSVCDTIEACVPLDDGYYTTDSDYLEFYFEGASALIEEYEIRIANISTNINQFGVFKVKEGNAEAMKTLCESYITDKTERWAVQAEYIASEYPKMQNAEVKIYGNYVVYAMLTTEDKATVFDAVENLLEQ